MAAAIDVVPLPLAEVTFPPSHPLAGNDGVVNGFLIRHPDAFILVDTGIGVGSDVIDAAYQPRRKGLEEALSALGTMLEDIDAVVNTHLHFDHCGGNGGLPSLPIYVQQAEYEVFTRPGYTVTRWVDVTANYETRSGDFHLLPGVEVLSTPGHTQGHQSILIETPEGPVLIAGQAVYSKAEYQHIRTHGTLLQDDPPPDPEAYLASALRLIEIAPVRVYFSHDRLVWTTQS